MSLLGSTIDYVHHLRGRLKVLQEERQSSTGSTAESPPLDARCCVGSLEEEDDAGPKIEADVRGTTVLLRVVCREKKGVLIMLLKELEKHGLSTINTNVLLLAGSSLNITITAQVHLVFIMLLIILSFDPRLHLSLYFSNHAGGRWILHLS